MTKPNNFLWPERASLTFSNARGKVYFTSADRKLDLADSLMQTRNYRTVYLAISTSSPKWQAWSGERVELIEDRIHYHLEFDGYRVAVFRLDIPSEQYRCTREFRWKLSIRPA